MKQLVKIVGMPMLGIVLVLVGFVYDLLFAGLPYQDPTPEIQSRWESHKFVANLFYETGGIIFLLGLFAAPFVLKIMMRKAPKSAAVAANDG